MRTSVGLSVALFFFALPFFVNAQDSILFKGQLSGWANYNPDVPMSVYLGGRYIPTLDYRLKQKQNRLIDFESSLNLNGSVGFNPGDSIQSDGKLKPYRLWARYSTEQLEIRLGLQKINFGSASMLRPLMWFDQLDPRDPLHLTDGVWGLLGRYYFMNNANLWLWGLYGNKDPKTWEIGKTSQKFPELGGRFQSPVPRGEAAVSYHFRMADANGWDSLYQVGSEIPENRIGLDAKWDVGIGLWTEGTWISKSKNIGQFTNQEFLNVGADYTLGIGNGIYAAFEQLEVSYDETPFAFSQTISFSALSVSYPMGIADNLNAIVYYDWTNQAVYNFVNWNHQFNHFSFYLMGYLNPKNYQIPQQDNSRSLFAGKGMQLMLVYSH